MENLPVTVEAAGRSAEMNSLPDRQLVF